MTYSANPFEAVKTMVDQFGLSRVDPNEIVLSYRMDLLKEELDETQVAVANRDAERVVDGHVDLVVVGLGNLAIMRVDIERAFDEVMEANMRKIPGKRVETDPVGVSLAKPNRWRPPNHSDNLGVLKDIFK